MKLTKEDTFSSNLYCYLRRRTSQAQQLSFFFAFRKIHAVTNLPHKWANWAAFFCIHSEKKNQTLRALIDI